MAGIVLCLGSGSVGYLDEIGAHFSELKGLNESFKYRDSECGIVKYTRLYDDVDAYYYESPDFIVCAVGSILYGKNDFVASLRCLAHDLDEKKHLSSIIDEMDGHFCLVIMDKNVHRCKVITDVGGVINVYAYQKNGLVCISTSMLALAKTFKVTPNNPSILMYLRSGMFFDYDTYFQEITTLKPASVYDFDLMNDKVGMMEYWSVPKAANLGLAFEDGAARISSSLKDILSFIPGESSLYDFTGGYDSRFVVALAYSMGKEINAFFFGSPASREAKIVEQNCSNLGMLYNNYVVQDDWPDKFFDYVLVSHGLGDGLEDACANAAVLMAQQVKKQKFAYSVHGALGELYRQRTWEFEFGMRGRKRPARLRRVIKYRNLADDFDAAIFSIEHKSRIKDVPDRVLRIYKQTNSIFTADTPNTLQLDYIFFSQRGRRWGGRHITTANQIIRSVSPFWFKRPLEISLQLNPEYKKRGKLMRYIMEEECPEVAREKMINDAPFVRMTKSNMPLFIPAVLFLIKKAVRKMSQIVLGKTIWAGLTVPDYDTGLWYRTALRDQRCRNLLSYDDMESRYLYNRETFNKFVRQAGMEGFHFYGQLGRIITIELTLRAVHGNQD